jgi:hypothetical protein
MLSVKLLDIFLWNSVLRVLTRGRVIFLCKRSLNQISFWKTTRANNCKLLWGKMCIYLIRICKYCSKLVPPCFIFKEITSRYLTEMHWLVYMWCFKFKISQISLWLSNNKIITTFNQNTAHKTTQTVKDTLHTMNTMQIQLELQLNKLILIKNKYTIH